MVPQKVESVSYYYEMEDEGLPESEVEDGMHSYGQDEPRTCSGRMPPPENPLLSQMAVTNQQILRLNQRLVDQHGQFQTFANTMQVYVDEKDRENKRGIENLGKDLNSVRNYVETELNELKERVQKVEEKDYLVEAGPRPGQAPRLYPNAPVGEGGVGGLGGFHHGVNFNSNSRSRSQRKPNKQCGFCHGWYAGTYVGSHMKKYCKVARLRRMGHQEHQ